MKARRKPTAQTTCGDKKKLIEAHLEMADLLGRCLFRQYGKKLPQEEFVSEARLGLTNAAEHFDPTRGTAFQDYAKVVIRNRVRQKFIEWFRQGRLDFPCFTDLAARGTGKDAHKHFDRASRTEREPWEIVADKEMVEQMHRWLPARSIRMLELHYMEGYSLTEIARKERLSKTRVAELLKEAEDRLRKRWQKEANAA